MHFCTPTDHFNRNTSLFTHSILSAPLTIQVPFVVLQLQTVVHNYFLLLYYPLSTLSSMGIVWAVDHSQALVVDSDVVCVAPVELQNASVW